MFARHGQSLLEYTMIVAILTLVLFYMGTSIKRGVQTLIKVTADQVGNQQEGDQDFNFVQQGYLMGSNTVEVDTKNRWYTEAGGYNSSGDEYYVMNTVYNESTNTMVNSLTNGGFTEAN